MAAYIEAVVILSYTKFPKPAGESYHVDEIRAAMPFLAGFKDASLVEREVRVGQWLNEDDAKALALAVTDMRILVYRAEVKRG